MRFRRRIGYPGRHGDEEVGMDPRRIIRIAASSAALLSAALLFVQPGPVHAQWFDVPHGFAAGPEGEPAASGDWRPLLIIRPVEGAFSELSRISLREVSGRVADPDAWLRARLTADTPDEGEADDLLASPDSPFGDPAFDPLRQAIPKLFAGVQELSRMPLQFCEGPNAAYNAEGPLRELYCVYPVGPFRQYLVLRLQQADGRWFYTEIRAMNERRLRQLLAITNSFDATP
jgi:hypothetical protein